MSVQSIERAFTLLRTIAEHTDGIGVSDLARQTNLHKSTVSRLVISLEAEQAIVREKGVLRIGNGITNLISPSLFPATLKALAHPFLEKLANTTGETAGLCVPDGNTVYYIDQLSSQQTVRIRNWTGERLPIQETSPGKIFLAYSAEKKVERFLSDVTMEQLASKSISSRAEFREHLTTVREQGFDWAYEEFSEGLVVVSGPVFNPLGDVVASIYLCGPVFRFPPERQKPRITQLVVDACQDLTELLHQQEA